MSGINQLSFDELVNRAKDYLEDPEFDIPPSDDIESRANQAVDLVMSDFIYDVDVFEFMVKNGSLMASIPLNMKGLKEITTVNISRLAIRETLRAAMIKELENATK